MRLAALALALLATAGAQAQSVSMAGSLGTRALLMIDGKPRQVAVGTTVEGVKLVSVTNNDAVVEVSGKRVALQLGGSPTNLGGAASAGTGDKIVLTSVSGGHFVTSGTINGSAVRFFVDTGATTVTMGAADAERIGVDYKKGQLGDVQVYNVEATVLPSTMPYMLLGNSFLDRFQMRRENDRLTLEKK